MIRLILGILFIFLSGCSAANSLVNSSKLNPPSWIIGKWSASGISYEFTGDNVIQTTTGSSTSYKDTLKNVSVSETITDSAYQFSYAAISLSFSKVSSSKIQYSITTSGITVGPVELSKV